MRYNRFFPVVLVFLFAVFLGSSGAAAQPATNSAKPNVQIKLIPEKTTVEPGEVIDLVIEQAIAPGWHTYWINPGDSGEKMQVEWTLPSGFKAGDMLWPVPEKIRIGDFISYAYENTARIVQPLFVPETLPEGPLQLTADIQLLVCADICIPEFSQVELVLNQGPAVTNYALLEEAYQALPADLALPSSYAEQGDHLVLQISDLPDDLLFDLGPESDFQLLPYQWGLIDDHAETVAARKGSGLALRHARGDRALSAFDEVGGLVSYVNSQGKTRAFTFRATSAAAEDMPVVTEAKNTAQPTAVKAEEGLSGVAAPARGQKGQSLWQALLFALLGGIILNLMPCVFPVLSLKALKLARLGEKERSAARWDAFFYTAGILLSFALFGFLMVVLREAGEQVGWGFQLQNPGFVLFLSWLLFAIGLNLSGFYEIGTGLSGKGSGLLGRVSGGHGTSFVTGVLAALVATPCIAPFMGVALGFALTQPTPVMLAVFLMLGFGLAVPYIALAVFPGLRSALPKPGPWMETFRQALAFPMYAAAIWLVWVYAQQDGAMQALVALSGALMLTFAIWLIKKAPEKGARRLVLMLFGLAFLALTAGLLVFATVTGGADGGDRATMQPVTAGEIGWFAYDAQSFAALEAGNKPLFVNMTASWCLTCKINERIGIETERTRSAFAEYDVQAVKGDWTNYNDEITAYLESFGRNGVPLYVYYGPRDPQTGIRPEPVILPQLLTPGTVEAAIEKN